jgi:rhamnosyltransferase
VPQNDASIIILTKNAGDDFNGLLGAIYAQKYPGKFEVIIIDSGSRDETINTAKGYDTKITNIKPEDFEYAKARNLGAELASGEYLVFLSSDAVPATNRWLSGFIKAFEDQSVAGAYGRQIPKENAIPMQYFFMTTKYPSWRMVRQAKEGKTDMDTIFFSNVNSAIRRRIWEDYPFHLNLVGTEDFDWAKRVLVDGYKIAYEPESAVYHSHNYSLGLVFQRYFDLGAALSQFASGEYATDKFITEGLAYVKKEMRFLMKSGNVNWLPYAVLYDLAKCSGVLLGKREKWIPQAFKKRLGMFKNHWQGKGKT